MKVELFADKECWEFKERFPDEFKSYGCGPGGIGDFLVPDTVYGLSIKEACRIHDWGYRHCKWASEEDRARHDRIFLNNMLRIIDAKTNLYILRQLRAYRCYAYYIAVRKFGARSYWCERNNNEELGVVNI